MGAWGVANLGTLYNLFLSNISLHSFLYILNNYVFIRSFVGLISWLACLRKLVRHIPFPLLGEHLSVQLLL